MARKDIINGLSYNQGFYNANDNFVELYNRFESGFIYRGNLTSLYPEGKSLNTLLPGIYNVNSWNNITDYPLDAYPYGLLVVFTPSVTTFAKAQMYFPDNRDFYYFRNGYGTTYNQWLTMPSTKQPNWIAATLKNGWTGNLYYRVNNIGQLEIHGLLTVGTAAPWVEIGKLVIPGLNISAKSLLVYNAQTGVGLTNIRLLSSGDITISNSTDGIAAGNTLALNEVINL